MNDGKTGSVDGFGIIAQMKNQVLVLAALAAGHPIAGPMLSTLTTYCSKESRGWLRQVLVVSGAFDNAVAVVFADFNRKWEKERTDVLFVRFAAKVKCPVFSGYPFGHVARSFAFDFKRPLSITPDGVMGYPPPDKAECGRH